MNMIGDRLHSVRQQKELSRIQLALRTGLQEYVLRDIENGITIPDLDTLERLAAGLNVPLVKLFCEGDDPPEFVNLPGRKTADEIANATPFRLSKKSYPQPISKSDNRST